MVKTVELCGYKFKAYDKYVPYPPKCSLCGKTIHDVPRIIWVNNGELEIDLCKECFNKVFELVVVNDKVYFTCKKKGD